MRRNGNLSAPPAPIPGAGPEAPTSAPFERPLFEPHPYLSARTAPDDEWRTTPSEPPPVPVAAGPPTREGAGVAMTAAGGGVGTATMERPPADETPPGSAKSRSPLRNAIEWVLIIGAALLAAVVIKTFLIQAFYIPSASMEHTLNIQDRVLVNKLSYRLHDINRGDIVVFERPPNDVGQIRDLIKRVVGLPGETVEGRDGTVFVDGRPLTEPYLARGVTTAAFPAKLIPEGYIWVMGDNRGNSSDSRVFGAVDESSIIGRAFVRVWPLTAIGLL